MVMIRGLEIITWTLKSTCLGPLTSEVWGLDVLRWESDLTSLSFICLFWTMERSMYLLGIRADTGRSHTGL